jgi:uncharacterized membrane protein YtjA (UPF0391 family)
MGLANTAVISANIAWTLCVVFFVLFVISLLFGRTTTAGPPV